MKFAPSLSTHQCWKFALESTSIGRAAKPIYGLRFPAYPGVIGSISHRRYKPAMEAEPRGERFLTEPAYEGMAAGDDLVDEG